MANSRRPHARQHKADVWSSAPEGRGGRTSSCAADREDAIPPAGVLTQESSEASGLRNAKTPARSDFCPSRNLSRRLASC
jgi:hypothetical protein